MLQNNDAFEQIYADPILQDAPMPGLNYDITMNQIPEETFDADPNLLWGQDMSNKSQYSMSEIASSAITTPTTPLNLETARPNLRPPTTALATSQEAGIKQSKKYLKTQVVFERRPFNYQKRKSPAMCSKLDCKHKSTAAKKTRGKPAGSHYSTRINSTNSVNRTAPQQKKVFHDPGVTHPATPAPSTSYAVPPQAVFTQPPTQVVSNIPYSTGYQYPQGYIPSPTLYQVGNTMDPPADPTETLVMQSQVPLKQLSVPTDYYQYHPVQCPATQYSVHYQQQQQQPQQLQNYQNGSYQHAHHNQQQQQQCLKVPPYSGSTQPVPIVRTPQLNSPPIENRQMRTSEYPKKEYKWSERPFSSSSGGQLLTPTLTGTSPSIPDGIVQEDEADQEEVLESLHLSKTEFDNLLKVFERTFTDTVIKNCYEKYNDYMEKKIGANHELNRKTTTKKDVSDCKAQPNKIGHDMVMMMLIQRHQKKERMNAQMHK